MELENNFIETEKEMDEKEKTISLPITQNDGFLHLGEEAGEQEIIP